MINSLQDIKDNLQEKLSHKSMGILRMFIILWCAIIIGASFVIDNPYVLAGIIAYEVLP